MDGQVIGVDHRHRLADRRLGRHRLRHPVSEIVSRIVAELRAKGAIERGWLGVSVEDCRTNGTAASSSPAVERNGPAARAGLQPGDVVIAVNGEPIDSRARADPRRRRRRRRATACA